VFDTLIARRGVEPRCVLDQLESRAGLPGLAAARLAADQKLWALGQPYSLADIWREVRGTLGLDQASADRFMALELQLEHDQVIPIAENLALVEHGVLLVSDTYLSAEVVRSLLRQAGFGLRVALVVSNDGKSRGWIWPQLLQRVAITQHLGDNPNSDGKTAVSAGASRRSSRSSPSARPLNNSWPSAVGRRLPTWRAKCAWPIPTRLPNRASGVCGRSGAS
jgi:hypothetical protein